MTCKYLYETTSWNRFGWFQCEVEDFKQFWHAYNHKHITNCYVVLANGQKWHWNQVQNRSFKTGWQPTLTVPEE